MRVCACVCVHVCERESVKMYTHVCITYSRSGRSNYGSGSQGNRSCLNSGGDWSVAVARPTKFNPETNENGNDHTKYEQEATDTEPNGQGRVCSVCG